MRSAPARQCVATKLMSDMAVSMCWKYFNFLLHSNIQQLEFRIIHYLQLVQTKSALIAIEIPYLSHLPSQTFREKELVLMAVPKRKTTPSKKKMRNRHKWLKNRTDIHQCAVCGNYKLAGHLCGNCVNKVKEETKACRKNDQSDVQWPIPDVLKNLVR